VPYVVVIGDKEMEESTINVTIREESGQDKAMKVQMTPKSSLPDKKETSGKTYRNCRLQNNSSARQSSSKEFELSFSFFLEDMKIQRAPSLMGFL
jgi:hypothetical protein